MTAKIPKIIHQTWKNSDIPEHFSVLAETWKEHHPGWKYILWTDEMNRDLVKTYCPEFITIYDEYANNIQRVDAVRYLILKKYGGIYVDIDFECLRNIEPLLEGEQCVFGIEPEEHAASFNKEMIICNAFMASIPNHGFFESIYENLLKVQLKKFNNAIDILESTGPFLLSDTYEKYPQKNLLTLLPSVFLYPLTIAEARLVISGEINSSMEEKINQSYAVHYFWGNWWPSLGQRD